MNLRQVLLSLAACAVAAGSFSAGRATGSGTQEARRLPDAAAIIQTSTTVDLKKAEQVDLATVTIENIAQVEFAQAYELLLRADSGVLAQWVRRLEALPAGPKKTGAIRTLFKTLVQVDTRAAIVQALRMENGDAQELALSAIRSAAPATEFRALTELALRPGAAPGELAGVAADWSFYDPAAAAECVTEHLVSLDAEAVSLVIGNWAAVDPAAARTWLANLPGSHVDAQVYLALYSGWVEADRAAAIADLAAHAGDRTRRKAIKNLAVSLFLESPDAATMLVNALREGGAAKTAVARIASYTTEQLIFSVPRQEIEPGAAARWMVALPDELWKDHIGEVVADWDRKDATGAARSWLRSLPWPMRDEVAAKFCASFDWEQPQQAFDAGFQISDPRLREQALRAAVQRMESVDGAERILSLLKLSARDAAELSKLVKQL